MLKSRAVVVFGLNELRGKTVNPQGYAEGAWNSSNAESLMRYTVNQGYTIQGWELGKKSYAQIWKVHLVWKQFALALDSHLKKKIIKIVIICITPTNMNLILNTNEKTKLGTEECDTAGILRHILIKLKYFTCTVSLHSSLILLSQLSNSNFMEHNATQADMFCY